MDFLKDLFAKAENGALTYDQFAEGVKTAGYKLADLSKGEYVAKKKYEDDLSGKDSIIADLNATIGTRDTDLKSLQEKLDKAGTDSAMIENLSGELTKMRNEYDAAKKEYTDKLNKQAYEFAVKEFAGEQSFSSNAAKRDFINSMIAKSLPMENGNIMGAKDYMAEYAKENGDAFVQKADPAPGDNEPTLITGGTNNPNGGDNGGKKQSLSELMKMKNDNPSMQITF